MPYPTHLAVSEVGGGAPDSGQTTEAEKCRVTRLGAELREGPSALSTPVFTVTVGHLGDTYKPPQRQGGWRPLVLDSLQPLWWSPGCGGAIAEDLHSDAAFPTLDKPVTHALVLCIRW